MEKRIDPQVDRDHHPRRKIMNQAANFRYKRAGQDRTLRKKQRVPDDGQCVLLNKRKTNNGYCLRVDSVGT
ncbi:hypothetical protein V1477_002397 [Vespula maculifrons]|uniref:Uncharacterized protein n=1 Tax=Vespula maculifrons TaxID=7453 RepID=A0ABD2CWD7_VESMC